MEHVKPSPEYLRFGIFEADLIARELRRNGVRVKLQDQPFQVLAILLQHPGEVVSREELRQRVWTADTFVDFDNGLNTAINKIREVLSDSAENPRFVQTLPRRGYRFIAPVDGLNKSVPQLTVVQEARLRRGVLVVGLAAVLAVGSGLSLVRRLNHRKPTPFEAMKITRLTTSGDVVNAVISPDGKYVVQVRQEAGQHSLWTRQVATGSNVQIAPPTPPPAAYGGLTFSPDGNYVYFVRAERRDNPAAVLYRVPVLGGGSRKIMDFLSGDINNSVIFSPDGSRIAFLREDHRHSELVVANVDGTGERELAERRVPEFIWTNPAWSPDGRLLAMAAGKHFGVAVVTVEAENGKERLIAPVQWIGVSDLAWLADGSGLVIAAREQEDSPSQIWLVSYPSGQVRRITNDLNSYQTVSLTADSRGLLAVQNAISSNVWVIPEGDATRSWRVASGTGAFGMYSRVSWLDEQQVLYSSAATGQQGFWISSPEGSNSTEVPLGPGPRSAVTCPSGHYIVFSSLLRSGKLNIWRADTDGGNQKQLTPTGEFWELLPDCSPDGKWVVYTSRNLNRTEETLQRVPIEGGDPAPLTRARLFEGEPSISPDGTRIAALFREDFTQPWTLAVIPSGGGEPVKTFPFPPGTNPLGLAIRWTPRGDAVAYISPDDQQNIWAQPLAGGEPRKLTNFSTDKVFRFAWSRGGHKLAVARGSQTTDVVLITGFR